MLDPRIYRMALILPALALVVLAFSLRSQPAALHARRWRRRRTTAPPSRRR